MTSRSGIAFGRVYRGALDLYALDRELFVPAVSGYRPAAAADTAIARMLPTFRASGIGA